MIEVYDRSRKKVAILENAFGCVETEKINAVGTLTFSLPDTDPKNGYCNPFWYVRMDTGTMYRIITPTGISGETGTLTYNCEHVIATLIDDVLFGAHTVGNLGIYTADSIQYILSHQTDANWRLGQCDFEKQYEYGWENENLLAALYSIPNRMVDPYVWTFDTAAYPWTVNLVRIDPEQIPQFYIRAGKNLLQQKYTKASQDVCTRLYCLGYGEGVNQLNIKGVNGGLPYLQSPQENIDKYGLISRIWVDRRFEDAQSLMERGQALLAEYQEPQYSIQASAADLYPITKADCDKAAIGRIALLVEDKVKTYITGIKRNHDKPGDMELTLATKPHDVAETIADLADRQRIEQVYSQGATQIYAQSVQANASIEKGAVLRFYIPADMCIVNFVNAKITLDRFRSYSKATGGGGSGSQTSTSGGGSTSTSGASNKTTTSTNDAVISAYQLTVANLDPGSSYGVITNTSSYHQHVYAPNLPGHQHDMSHTHTVSTPDHKHSFDLPDHVHDIEQGIFEFGSASAADIYINGILRGNMGKDLEMDISEYLLNDKMELPRGSWLSVEVRPNDLAYITIDLIIKGFVQSKGGGTY